MPDETSQTVARESLTRRTVLRSIGVVSGIAVIGSAETSASESTKYVVSQGEQCYPVVPLSGPDPVKEMYDYRVPYRFTGDNGGVQIGRGPYYESLGTVDLQRPDTTIAFLYEGPDGLSLVVVHDHVDDGGADGSGGAVTWTVSGLPSDGEWAVKDSYLIDRETGEIADIEKDRWDISGTTHTIDWTWGRGSTDGGVFRGLSDSFEITIQPAYNEAAALWGEWTSGLMTDWQFLSGSWSSPSRFPLALDQPVTITTGECTDESSDEENEHSNRSEEGKGREKEAKERKKEREEEREERKEERKERKEEREEEREERKEEREERKEEREEEREERKEEREERKREREEDREERKKKRKNKNNEPEGEEDDDDEEGDDD